MLERLMVLLRLFRDPKRKPPVTAELDARLDDAERRLEARRKQLDLRYDVARRHQ